MVAGSERLVVAFEDAIGLAGSDDILKAKVYVHVCMCARVHVRVHVYMFEDAIGLAGSDDILKSNEG